MVNYILALKEVFSKPKYLLITILSIFILIPIFAVTSDLLIFPMLELNPTADLLKILLVVIIVVLIAVNSTVILHNYEARKDVDKKTTLLGSFIGLFTTTCPVCQPIWLVWLGLGSASAFLTQISIYVGLLSISLLLISLHYSLKSVYNTCKL